MAESEVRDEAELAKLKESYGTTGSKLATGGNKAVKDLEKEQKTRATRLSKDFIDICLLDLQEQFQDNFLNYDPKRFKQEKLINLINNIQLSREKLVNNSSVQITIESLFCAFDTDGYP
jgi:DNA polymerase-3 subunit delta'